MACNASKAPLLRAIAARGYAAQASHKASSSTEVHSSTLPNKVVVATAESNLPICRVSILFRAGSRNETYESTGASHMMRIAAALSNKNSTNFAVTRNLQQVGASLSVTADREVIAYTTEVLCSHLETALKYLEDVATAPAFKPWELSDSLPRLRTEIATIPSQVRAVELLHRAAYRQGLGNSIFCPKTRIGKLSSEALQHYYNSNCTAERCAVVAVGVDPRTLGGFAQNLRLQSGSAKPSQAKYYGGDARSEKGGNIAHVAIAGEGGSLNNLKEAAAFAVLQQAAGVGPATKRGACNGALGKVVTNAAGSTPFNFSALNASYTDSGLFGFVVSTEANVAGKVVDAAVKALKSGSVSADDVQRGKAQLKAALINNNETDGGLLAEMASQAILLGNVQGTKDLIAAIDAVTPADVSAASKKVASSKLSVGAVGNLSSVPYAADLN